ncbi:MAG: hypothetical protein PUD93_07455 [Lachnospiraceae bacterium]|nr:hypothetical protein [Lachnospiraceae bacterium]
MKTKNRTYNDFEHDYFDMFGIYFDIHYHNLIMRDGLEKADKHIRENVDKLNAKLKQEIYNEQHKYDFQPIPDGTQVPF